MPDLDLEPRDYRATPVKGEKAFAPGGLGRLLAYIAVIAAGVLISVVLSPISGWVSAWLRSLMR